MIASVSCEALMNCSSVHTIKITPTPPSNTLVYVDYYALPKNIHTLCIVSNQTDFKDIIAVRGVKQIYSESILSFHLMPIFDHLVYIECEQVTSFNGIPDLDNLKTFKCVNISSFMNAPPFKKLRTMNVGCYSFEFMPYLPNLKNLNVPRITNWKYSLILTLLPKLKRLVISCSSLQDMPEMAALKMLRIDTVVSFIGMPFLPKLKLLHAFNVDSFNGINISPTLTCIIAGAISLDHLPNDSNIKSLYVHNMNFESYHPSLVYPSINSLVIQHNYNSTIRKCFPNLEVFNTQMLIPLDLTVSTIYTQCISCSGHTKKRTKCCNIPIHYTCLEIKVMKSCICVNCNASYYSDISMLTNINTNYNYKYINKMHITC